MLLTRAHDPHQNAALLRQLSMFRYDARDLVEETELLFQQYCVNEPDLQRKNSLAASLLKRFSFSKSKIETWKTIVDEKGQVYPEWKPMLDMEYQHLRSKVKKEVNIADYGAVGDGVTDNTAVFNKAIGNGKVIVHVPEGIFITKGIKLPSWTGLVGAGKWLTTIKLHPEAPKGTRLVTNAHHRRGNHHIVVEGMSLDWNVERLGNEEKTASGNNRSSCLTYAHVTYGWVKDVEAINAGLHGFDVSSTIYHYAGDGFIAPGRSQYVWLDQLNGYGFGDDGVTTHHSDNILITNCHMCDPSGRAHQQGFSNSNGIEVDDGSRNVWLVNNSTARCFGGVEIKAHHNASAASNVTIIGHISENDNRSFNFRHIGHHKDRDPESKTAFNIKATNLVAIAPIFTELYKDSTPRAMVVSAYQNVVINQFTMLGDPDYDFQGNPVMAIQYRAQNVVLKNIFIQGFKNAKDVKGKCERL